MRCAVMRCVALCSFYFISFRCVALKPRPHPRPNTTTQPTFHRSAHGLPPPRPLHPRRRRLRRIPHPPRNHRRRRHPPRPRRPLHDQLRLTGHGPRRRSHHPHLANRRQDETTTETPRPRCRLLLLPPRRTRRQPTHPTLPRQIHHQPGHRPRHVPPRRIHRPGKTRRSSLVEALLLRSQTRNGRQGGDHRLGADGRSQCLHSHPAAGVHASHVRGATESGRGGGRDVRGVRFEIGRGGGDEREVGVGEGGGGGGGDEARGEEGYGEERCHAGCEHRSGDVRGGGGWEEVVVRAFGEGVVGAAFLFVLGVGKLKWKERKWNDRMVSERRKF
mmetsp:Transcript_2964/g.7034  ORF Transcript_2964/g.7034 Transcript_2964/m.7034 type:complete len:331 (+) Transcript_2964:22-1014(+)